MRSDNYEATEDGSDAEQPHFGSRSRPQRSSAAKKPAVKPRAKGAKRTSSIGGLHQRRNKRMSW